ncbi:MAG: carbohydrate ABC transporter permease [Bacteroidota bacterium]
MSEQAKKKFDAFPYLLVIPAISIVALVYFYPILKGIGLSLTDAKFVEKANFIGLKNYIQMFQDPSFIHACYITVLYSLFYIIGVFAVGLGTALLLNAKFKGRPLARMLMIIPYAIPDLAAVLVWNWLFDYQYGVLNYVLKGIGWIAQPVQWLADPKIALFSVLLVSIWRLFPFHTLALLSALQGVPEELYEAAHLDGANRFQRFLNVTLPSIKSIMGILLLLTVIWSFQRFTILWTLTQGGPSRATETIVVQVYLKAFKFYEMGYAGAIGTVTVLFLMLITLIYFALTRESSK